MTPSDCLTPKRGVGKHGTKLSFTETELYHFKVPIGRNAKFLKIGIK